MLPRSQVVRTNLDFITLGKNRFRPFPQARRLQKGGQKQHSKQKFRSRDQQQRAHRARHRARHGERGESPARRNLVKARIAVKLPRRLRSGDSYRGSGRSNKPLAL